MRATTIEGQNALLHRCALRKVHVTDGQNTRDQITSDRRSKHAWSKCVLCIPFILSGGPKECWLHTCDACVIKTWRLGLRAPLAVCNEIPTPLIFLKPKKETPFGQNLPAQAIIKTQRKLMFKASVHIRQTNLRHRRNHQTAVYITSAKQGNEQLTPFKLLSPADEVMMLRY